MSFPLFFRALHLMLASSSGVSKCFLGFQGSRKDFAQQKLCGIISGLPQRFCAAKALWDNFRAPAKIAWRVLWEEERQAYQVMRQTKRAADQTALPRRGGLFAACELGNGIFSVPFQGSRADAKQMRGKRRRKPSGQAARNAAADLRALRRRERGFHRARRWRGIRSSLRWHDGGSICRNFRYSHGSFPEGAVTAFGCKPTP